MKNTYKYNGDFNNVVTISDLRRQVFINAICFSDTMQEAADEIGRSRKDVFRFLKEEKINDKMVKQLRIEFQKSKIKIKRRFNN